MFNALRTRLQKQEEGFTLIELLVVVIIIGILAAIAIPAFLNQRESAWRAAVESDLRNAAVEMETVATQNQGLYPTSTSTDPAAPTFSTSTGVDVEIGASSTSSAFCLTGDHANLGTTGTSVDLYYDSDGGGLTETAC